MIPELTSDHALSDTVSVILIICLVLIAVIVAWSMLGGSATSLKKTVIIAEKAEDINTSFSAHAIRLLHTNGDSATLNQSAAGQYTPVSFTLISPNDSAAGVYPSPLMKDTLWQPGKTVTFYRDNSGYYVIDNLSARTTASALTAYGPLVDLERGLWTVKTVDDSATTVINSITVYVNGNGTAADTAYSPGLIATYYTDQAWTTGGVSNIASRVYFADTASGRTSDVANWPVPYISKADHFSVMFDGYYKVDTEADYTFTLSSDDGSFMDLDGVSNFISNGGDHSYQSVSATRHLKPGYHPITIRMYENGGSAVVYLTYQTPSMAAAQVATQLYHLPRTAPSVDFTAAPRAGPAPLAVQFTDGSVDATSWTWDFGDGSPASHSKSPSHTYTASGTKTVTLTGSNAFGSNSATKSGYITVGSFSPGFLASYYYDQAWSSLAGTRIDSGIHYSDQSGSTWPASIVGSQDDFSVMWDGYLLVPAEADYSFTLTSDDGSYLWVDESQLIDNGGLHSSTAVTRSVHLTAGYHHVVVKMYENTGTAVADLSYTPAGSIWHIPSTAPVADFTAVPRAGTAPLAVQFTDASSDATGWSWDFGDGGTSTAQNPVHTYTAAGSYPVTLTATNDFGSQAATKSGYITIGTSYVPGFTASYYRGQAWTDLAGTRTDSQIQFTDQGGSTWPVDMVGRQEDFSVTWDGYLHVPADATYSFRLTSDDGSWLWVDENQVIDNSGLHSSTAVTGSAALAAGYHHIVVKMFENTGSAVARLDYAISPSASYAAVTDVYHVT